MTKHGLGWGHAPEKPPMGGGVMIPKNSGSRSAKRVGP